MHTAISLLAALVALIAISDAAKCGRTEFFEYKFRPIKVKPVKSEDIENSKARCGEKHCDIMITLFGSSKCHKGDHGFQFSAPSDKNEVVEGEFRPEEHGWKAFADWKLSEAASTPFKIEVCDDDSFFRGSNDHLMTIEHEELRPGCHRHRHNDHHPDHPWLFDYELCCRAVGGSSQRRTSGRWDRREQRRRQERRREEEDEEEEWGFYF